MSNMINRKTDPEAEERVRKHRQREREVAESLRASLEKFGATLNGQKETLRPGDDISKGGVKFDQGKRMIELVPVDVVNGWADVLTYGAKKYEARNWEKGMDYSRPYGAALRHLFAWWSGEDIDPDTGLSHLDHAICNLGFLSAYTKRSVGNDDRSKQG